MRQNRSFTQRQKHAIQPCRLSLGGPLFGPIPLAAPDPKRTLLLASEPFTMSETRQHIGRVSGAGSSQKRNLSAKPDAGQPMRC